MLVLQNNTENNINPFDMTGIQQLPAKRIRVFSRFFFKTAITACMAVFGFFTANAQIPPGLDPSMLPEIPLNQAPSQVYQEMMRTKNGESGIGKDIGLGKKDKLDRDSLIRESTPQTTITTETTYGMNLFKSGVVASISELSTPPLDYPLGVYDEVVISLWNRAEATLSYTIARDGSIFPQGIGKIYLQGLTFENARAMLTQRFMQYVPPGTNIAVSIGQPRTIVVNVTGEVNKQGPVTVSAFTNAFNVIALAGGPTNMANLREIQIKRNGRIIDELDVYRYLTTGDFGKHIYLENNDFVILKSYTKRVKAEGRFKRPMYYQLKANEGVKELLYFSGGLQNDAFTSGLKVYRTEFEKQVIKDVNATAIINPTNKPEWRNLNFPLIDGDIVKVIAINPGLVNKVEIKGEISYPGQYEIRRGEKLFNLLNRAGGITRNTYLHRAYIFRGGGDSTNIKSSKLEVSLTALKEGVDAAEDTLNLNNVEVFPNDQIVLFNNNQFGDKQFVEIFGEVRKEGKQNKYGGMTLQDLIYLSGGLKQSAEYGRIEISSVVDIDSAKNLQTPTRTVVKSIKLNAVLELDSAAAQIELKPYDQVYVRKNPTFELQQLIQLNGLIRYPGPYPRLDKYEKLSSYIERAGGVMENADLSGALLFRKRTQYFGENITKKAAQLTDSLGNVVNLDSAKISAQEALQEPISIDLYKAIKYKNTKYDIILQDGDMIIVPEINPFVSVEGTVQSAIKLTFDKEHTNIGYYIDKAGGYGRRPWRNRIYVTYANGKSKRTRNFAFLHFYPKVEEGSKIVVPFRPEGKEISDAVGNIVTASIPIVLGTLMAKIIAKF